MHDSVFAESSVVIHLFKTSSAYKRIRWDFCSSDDHYTNICQCDLTFEIIGTCIDGFKGFVSRKDEHIIKSGEEMVLEMMGFINYMYVKIDGHYKFTKNILTASQRRAMYMTSKLGKNMKTLPLVIGPNYPRARIMGQMWNELPYILMFVDSQRFGLSIDELLLVFFSRIVKLEVHCMKEEKRVHIRNL